MAEMLLECTFQEVGQLKKEAFPKGPPVGCLPGLGRTAAAYVEEPRYHMCSEYSVRGRVCVFDMRRARHAWSIC